MALTPSHAALAAAIWLATVVPGCYGGGTELIGLAERNPSDTGPTIIWDLEARPIPEIPFPNDVGTRTALDSPTGRRINVSREASTRHESQLRTSISRLDGFGTYAPIWVRFDDRIDVEDLYRRQTDADRRNDGIYLFNVDRDSPQLGTMEALDVGSGPPAFKSARFPILLQSPAELLAVDPRAGQSNLMFDTVEEDLDRDGVLDPGEDTDGDGVLDHPNLWGTILGDDRLLDPYRHLITFYETETDTLIVRPIFPLRQQTTYAVVVTRRIRGAATASPVRSPFSSINHIQQTAALAPLLDDGILTSLGVELDDVAFAWSFTTQSITKELESIRSGLYGYGPLARLAMEFPARLTEVFKVDDTPGAPNPYVLPVPIFKRVATNDTIIGFLDSFADMRSAVDELITKYEQYVDYFIFAAVDSPSFISTEEGTFRLDWQSGVAEYEHETIYINCAVPKARAGHQPPFRVIMHQHGTGNPRLQFLLYAADIAKVGVATCAIDAYGHGLPAGKDSIIDNLVREIAEEEGFPSLYEMVIAGRALDLNGDGTTNPAGDFWTVDLFHSRDAIRQTAIDYFQTLRVLRTFGHGTMPVDVDGDGRDELAGDFNGDGVADFGGEQPYSLQGQSLGGIVTAVAAAMEPLLKTAVPISAGAGLLDVAIRSEQTGIDATVYLSVLGALVSATKTSQDRYLIEIHFKDFDTILGLVYARREPVARIPDAASGQPDAIQSGDRVELHNLDNGEIFALYVPADVAEGGGFRLSVAADQGDRLELRFYRADRADAWVLYRTIDTIEQQPIKASFNNEPFRRGSPLVAMQDGFGLQRATPAFRIFMSLGQMVMDAGDPANYARFYHHPIEMVPDGAVPTNVLIVNTIGDMTVPINTGVALARIAGVLGYDEIDPRYGVSQEQLLLDRWVVEGLEEVRRFEDDPCYHDTRELLFDVDEAAAGRDPDQGPHPTGITIHPACIVDPVADFCVPCAAQLPLRAEVTKPWGVSAVRFPYIVNTGTHSYQTADPSRAFDYILYQINQAALYQASGGQQIVDAPCMGERPGCDTLW